MKKIKDLVVKVGEYQKDGETKPRWKNVGALMENDNGQFLFLDKTFNPAGIETESGRESIIISMFDPKGKDQRQESGMASDHEGPYRNHGSSHEPSELDDEIPF